AYRSNEQGWMYRYHDPSYGGGRLQRVVRKADAYLNLSGRNLVGWDELDAGGGLYRVPSSRFLRPYSSRLRHLEPLKYRRIVQDLKAAAVSGRIYHLWWHPHNFGRQTDRNLDGLEWILRAFDDCRRRYGMTSLSMSGVAELARHA
ncbi:MAG: hypothetical protein U0835_24450, partial [Isosphaeraceae bacterium]